MARREYDRRYLEAHREAIEILISDQPPKNISHEVQHAFTIHSIQGEPAKHLLFVDARRMFEMQHWYTALSRGQYIDLHHRCATV